MTDLKRPDGAVIHYETFGSGYPLLLIAPGGLNSEIGFWARSAINPIEAFQDDFLVIAMDQRHAGGSWNVPPSFSYALATADQLAVLDAVGVERAHVMGGCIGVAYLLRLIAEAPERISAAVGQDPVGLDETNSTAVFTRMFEPTIALARSEGVGAVVASALENPLFVMNNAAGPFAQRISNDPAFRAELEAMDPGAYVALVEDLSDALWPDRAPYMTVDEEWVRRCPAPLLILPGSDEFHPTSIARKICAEAPDARCLDVDCRSEAKLPATIEAVRDFLLAHRGA